MDKTPSMPTMKDKISAITHQVSLVQHVFIDIVKFTQNRSVEDQARLVGFMNEAVLLALAEEDIDRETCVLLPTGDGMCISLRKPEPYDLGVKFAKRLLWVVAQQNSDDKPDSQKYELRIGVNQNHDNLLTDINGNSNVAGRGINMAQRVMSLADESQIFIGEPIFEILRERESYKDLFRKYTPFDKHGNPFTAYQLVDGTEPVLNIKHPAAFVEKKPKERVLSEYAAHYMANAEKFRKFLVSKTRESNNDENVVALLHFLTRDSIYKRRTIATEKPIVIVELDADGTPDTFYEHLDAMNTFVIEEIDSMVSKNLSEYSDLFERRSVPSYKIFGNERGLLELQEKFLSIWKEIAEQ